MHLKISKSKFILSLVAAVLVTAVALSCAAWALLGESGRTLVYADHTIKKYFVGDYEETKWLDATLKTMISALEDRWSYYADADYYAYMQESRDGSYVGIGVVVGYENLDGLTVSEVTEGSPAESAGVLPGDVIVAVDGVPYQYEARRAFVNSISGEDGSTVVLDVQRAGSVLSISLVRARVDSVPVRSKVEDGIAVITYTNFYLGSGDKFIAEMQELQAQGIEGVVLDLRGNPGGYVTDLVQVLDYILPEGPIFRSIRYDGSVRVTESDAEYLDLPMVVLVDEDSYSAAEFCAAQLHESAGVPLVGAATSGKGYSQQALELPNGGAFNLSTAEYRTGGDVSLAGVGLTPDYELARGKDTDLQMEKAMEVIAQLVAEKY